MGDRSWRRLDPGLWEWELAYGPVIDRLKPDIIHANDFRMLGVGARASFGRVRKDATSSWCGTRTSSFPGISRGTPTRVGISPSWHTNANTPGMLTR